MSEAIARRNIRGERGWIAERAHAVVGPEPQTGAMNVDPGFNSPGTTHYTLKSTSLARNAADPSSTISIERGRDSVAVVGDLV